MKIALSVTATFAAATLALAAPAAADPPVNPESGHVHHVWLGNGECHEINAVTWAIADRGMHRGANSSGTTHGPWHGPCPA